jgi:hypothetical protein
VNRDLERPCQQDNIVKKNKQTSQKSIRYEKLRSKEPNHLRENVYSQNTFYYSRTAFFTDSKKKTAFFTEANILN